MRARRAYCDRMIVKEDRGVRSYEKLSHLRRAETNMRRLGYAVESDEAGLLLRWRSGRQPVVPGDAATVRSGPHSGLRGTVESVSGGVARLSSGGRTFDVPSRSLHAQDPSAVR